MLLDPTQLEGVPAQDVGDVPTGLPVGDDWKLIVVSDETAAAPHQAYEWPVGDALTRINPADLWAEVQPIVNGTAVPGSIGQKYFHGKAGNAIDIYQHNGTTWLLKRSIGVTTTNATGPANAAPTVALTVSTASLVLGGSFTLAAVPADSDGTIARVDFYEGGTLLISKTAAPYLHDVTPATAGTKTYTAVAFDNQGASRSSTPQSVAVLAPSNQLPTVTGSLSASSVQVGQSVTFSAVATDSDGTITQVQFFDSSTLLGTVTDAPYSVSYAPTQTGTRSLFVKATDNSGAVRTTAAIPLTVTAQAGNLAPTVSLTASPSAPIVGQTLSLTATPADPDGTIAKVEYFNGSTKLGETTQSPHSFSLPITSAGTNFFTAKATDNLGATGLSAVAFVLASAAPVQNVTPEPPAFASFQDTQAGGQVTLVPASGIALSDYRVALPGSSVFNAVTSEIITVGNVAGSVRAYSVAATGRNQSPTASSAAFTAYTPPANAAPAVSLTLGNTGTVANAAQQTATVTATDSDGTIASVVLTDNGTTIPASNSSSPFTFAWTPTGAGSHTVTATGTDNSGAVTTSTASFTLAAAIPVYNITLDTSNPTDSQQTDGAFFAPASSQQLKFNGRTGTGASGVTLNVEFVDTSDGSTSYLSLNDDYKGDGFGFVRSNGTTFYGSFPQADASITC